jgi:hypothetical protein
LVAVKNPGRVKEALADALFFNSWNPFSSTSKPFAIALRGGLVGAPSQTKALPDLLRPPVERGEAGPELSRSPANDLAAGSLALTSR